MSEISRRYYAKGKKTYAKDQAFDQDQVGEEKERYLISIGLMSLKTLKDYDNEAVRKIPRGKTCHYYPGRSWTGIRS